MPPSRGLLIVIEGLDRSGKTTQCQRLLASIHSHPPSSAHLQKFPDRTTPTGVMINDYLTSAAAMDDHSIHLLFSANRWEARAALLAHLAAGTTVLVDRYSFSGAVYSAAKQNPDLDLRWAWGCEVGLPRPDLVVFLDVDEHVQEARGGWGEERYEKRDMQRRVRGLFGEVLGRAERELGVRVGRVDAGGSLDEVQRRVWELYVEVKEEGVGDVGKLRELRFD